MWKPTLWSWLGDVPLAENYSILEQAETSHDEWLVREYLSR
jgi:hypothetical protein